MYCSPSRVKIYCHKVAKATGNFCPLKCHPIPLRKKLLTTTTLVFEKWNKHNLFGSTSIWLLQFFPSHSFRLSSSLFSFRSHQTWSLNLEALGNNLSHFLLMSYLFVVQWRCIRRLGNTVLGVIDIGCSLLDNYWPNGLDNNSEDCKRNSGLYRSTCFLQLYSSLVVGRGNLPSDRTFILIIPDVRSCVLKGWTLLSSNFDLIWSLLKLICNALSLSILAIEGLF